MFKMGFQENSGEICGNGSFRNGREVQETSQGRMMSRGGDLLSIPQVLTDT